MILTREGAERAEVDLVAPEPVAGEPPPVEAAGYPQPVCPDGSPTFGLPDETEGDPPAPGVSPLDEFFPPPAPPFGDGGAP